MEKSTSNETIDMEKPLTTEEFMRKNKGAGEAMGAGREAEKKNKKNAPRRKKRSRFFESYITKILHQVSENGINTNAKQQLNTIFCQICKEICNRAIELTEYADKKTISIKEIKNSLKLILSGEFLEHTVKEGDDAVSRYEVFNQTKITLGTRLPAHSRTMKAEIIFPPSILEKFLRRFGYSKLFLTGNTPVFLAAVIEYIAAEILNISSLKAQESGKSRITVRHIELGVRSDPDFSLLFEKLNLKFLGSGFTPGIHKELLVKKKTNKKKIKEEKEEKVKKAHRYKPGTVALKTIKKYQKTGKLMLARNPFERLVRSIFEEGEIDKKKISKDVFTVLQYHIEQNIIQTLRLANLITLHCKRTKLSVKDILLVRFISVNPYNFTLQRYDDFINQMDNLSLDESHDSPEEAVLEAVKKEEKTEDKEEFEEVSSEEDEISDEDEVPTEDSEEELEYMYETDFLETDTEMPWAGPKYFKSRSRVNGNKEDVKA